MKSNQIKWKWNNEVEKSKSSLFYDMIIENEIMQWKRENQWFEEKKVEEKSCENEEKWCYTTKLTYVSVIFPMLIEIPHDNTKNNEMI